MYTSEWMQFSFKLSSRSLTCLLKESSWLPERHLWICQQTTISPLHPTKPIAFLSFFSIAFLIFFLLSSMYLIIFLTVLCLLQKALLALSPKCIFNLAFSLISLTPLLDCYYFFLSKYLQESFMCFPASTLSILYSIFHIPLKGIISWR